jgi:hypothetical protein
MAIRDLILQDLENLLNTNAQGIDFVLGRPAVMYNANFAIERIGNNWYEVVTEEFVPVVVNSFSGGFLAQPDVKSIQADIVLSFLIPFENEPVVLGLINDFVESLAGRIPPTGSALEQSDYNVVYAANIPDFAQVQLYNDIRFIQYNVVITATAMEQTFSANHIKISLFNDTISNEYIELPVIAYTPGRMRNTTVIQETNTSSGKSIAKNSVWSATINTFLSLKTDKNPLTTEILKILEDSSQIQNKVFLLKIEYTLSDYTVIKSVIITGVQTSFVRGDISNATIMLEEAYTEVL